MPRSRTEGMRVMTSGPVPSRFNFPFLLPAIEDSLPISEFFTPLDVQRSS